MHMSEETVSHRQEGSCQNLLNAPHHSQVGAISFPKYTGQLPGLVSSRTYGKGRESL